MRFLKRLFGGAGTNPQPEHDALSEILADTFRFVAVDVETANSDTTSICQLGLALVTDGDEIRTIRFLIDPESHFDAFNTDLHGISAATVMGRPVFPDVIQVVRPFLQRHPLIQHSNFDKGAITGACGRYGLPPLNASWHDSVMIARLAWPELRGDGGHGLANLRDFLDLEFHHHDAAEDAKAAALVVLHAEHHTGLSFGELTAVHPRGGGSYERKVTFEGSQSGPLFGHVACFTGALSLSRTEAATLAAGAGITVKAGISKKVTLLIVGDQDLTLLAGHAKSSKHRRAEELIAEGHGIRILGESEFLALVGK